MGERTRLREFSLLSNETIIYSDTAQLRNVRKLSVKSVLASFKLYLYEAFLPRGYPESVSDDYAAYQLWDSLQAFCSTLSGMLAVQSVLLGVGVGQANATPLAAAIAWLTKDGIGMISAITFAWLKGTSLDADCKKWRLFADFVNDLALCIELSISMWRMNAVFLLCISSGLKALVGVAGGSTRAVLTQHQAIRGNTADVAAKDGSQETLVNLVTTVFGIGLIHLEFTQRYAWILMLIFVVFHLFFNYRAVKSLKLKTVNEERLWILFTEYNRTNKILLVEEVNLKESVILGFRNVFRPFSVKIGQSLRNVGLDCEIIKRYKDAEFLLCVEKEKNSVTIALKSGVSDWTIFSAYFQAMAQFTELRDGIFGPNVDIYATCLEFRNKAELAGWEIRSALLPVGPWRYQIDSKAD